jgi:hypothetical protein
VFVKKYKGLPTDQLNLCVGDCEGVPKTTDVKQGVIIATIIFAGATVFMGVLIIVMLCKLGKRRAWGLWMAMNNCRRRCIQRERERKWAKILKKRREVEEEQNDIQQSKELNGPGTSDVEMTQNPMGVAQGMTMAQSQAYPQARTRW